MKRRQIRAVAAMVASAGTVLAVAFVPASLGQHVLTSGQGIAAGAGKGSGLQWHGTWRAAPQQPQASGPSHDGLDNQTARMVIHSTVGGHQLRVRFSNAYGTAPVVLGKVDVALQRRGPTTEPRSDHSVTFSGQQSVTIPVGQEVVSDAVDMMLRGQENLVVSVYFPDATGPATWHFEAESTTYFSTPGDWAAEPGGSPYQTITPSWFYLDGVDVLGQAKGTVVAFGDSITDGHYSTIDGNGRWPDWLARRIPNYAVLNEGIGGNRVLTDGSGESALHRFGRDAINQLGVTAIIFLEGINDIDNDGTTAGQVIAGIQQVIDMAHAACLPIFGGTLTPYQGASSYTDVREGYREAVNQWIRTSGAFDGVIDFDKAVRDPNNPLALDPRYDTGGGHLHPNDLGYKAMADAIDLSLLRTSHPVCS